MMQYLQLYKHNLRQFLYGILISCIGIYEIII